MIDYPFAFVLTTVTVVCLEMLNQKQPDKHVSEQQGMMSFNNESTNTMSLNEAIVARSESEHGALSLSRVLSSQTVGLPNHEAVGRGEWRGLEWARLPLQHVDEAFDLRKPCLLLVSILLLLLPGLLERLPALDGLLSLDLFVVELSEIVDDDGDGQGHDQDTANGTARADGLAEACGGRHVTVTDRRPARGRESINCTTRKKKIGCDKRDRKTDKNSISCKLSLHGNDGPPKGGGNGGKLGAAFVLLGEVTDGADDEEQMIELGYLT